MNTKIKTENNKMLLPKIEALCEKEADNGVKKKYLYALEKGKKYMKNSIIVSLNTIFING
ncbi:MAG TPA: hypothetical protein DIW27_11760 [Cytophagales bacterium]|nr:hypothetical protein [Cytophagales bacterium]